MAFDAVKAGNSIDRLLVDGERAQAVRVIDGRQFFNGHEVGDVRGVEFDYFTENYGDQLAQMYRVLDQLGAKKIVLEAAHIYGYEAPGIDHYKQMRLAAKLKAVLEARGIEVVSSLLIDDFHSDGKIDFDMERYVQEALVRGWPIDEVYFESDMAGIATVMIDTLDELGKVLDTDAARVLSHAKIHLLKRNKHGVLEPSCAALDAAFTCLKLGKHNADAIINILPGNSGYRRQQYNTRSILRGVLGQQTLPFLNFYVSLESDGKVGHRVGSPHEYR